jgi:hypothetical protein
VIPDEQTFWKFFDEGREDDAWDFKQEINFSDTRAFAKFIKHLLGFSNFGGGYLLLGVTDADHEIIGVHDEIDPAKLGDKVEAALGFPINFRLSYFNHSTDNASFRLGLLSIPGTSRILMSKRDLPGGNDEPIVRKDDVYYRRNTRTIKATAEDYEAIFKRLTLNQAANAVVIENEFSALKAISKRSDAIHIGSVLLNRFEINAVELGFKLWELWKFKSRYSKLEFAQLMQIPSDKIDDYFEGKELLDLNRIVVATKLFDLSPDYFFRPTYNMRGPFWQEDMVKYAILSLVQPKEKIADISNQGWFYAHIVNQLADRICDLHALLYPDLDNPIKLENVMQSDLGRRFDLASKELKSAMRNKYYKLLEQYPRSQQDRSLVPAEEILQHWFFATDEYIARLIIEGISHVDIQTPNKPVIKYRFEEDLDRGAIAVERYDSTNLRINSSKPRHFQTWLGRLLPFRSGGARCL